MNIELTLHEQFVVKYLAGTRQNKPWNKISAESQLETDLHAVGSEIAFCKRFLLYPDLDVDPRPYDVMLPSGITVDVKHTKFEDGRLLCERRKRNYPTDIYFLVTGTFPTYTTHGWATKEELMQDFRLHDFGYGPHKICYGMDQDELHKEETLLTIARNTNTLRAEVTPKLLDTSVLPSPMTESAISHVSD